MKNLIILSIIICCISINSFSQEKIDVTREGISEVSIKTNSDKSVIYSRVISWVNSTYKNPKEVLVGQVENESVTVSGYATNAWYYKSIGITNRFNMKYQIYINIYDDSLTFRVSEGDSYTSDGNKFLGSSKSFFKRSGEPRGAYEEAVISLEETLNNLWLSFEGKVNNDSLTSEEALSKLKKAKDKLDLELITQEEYDKIKEELSKYIK